MARAIEFDEAHAVQKAMEVFWQNGYAATSMRDLARAMRINSSSLYNTLGDKRQLFIKALKHYTDLRRRAFQQYDGRADSPFRVLATFITDAVETITTEPNSCMCVRTAFEMESEDSEIQAIIIAYNKFTHQFLKQLIERAQDQGEIAQRVEATVIADYLSSAFIGWYNSYILHHDRTQIQRIAAYLIQQLKK